MLNSDWSRQPFAASLYLHCNEEGISGFRVGNLFEIMSDNVVVRWLCHEFIAVNSKSILCSSHYKVL